MGQKRSVLGLGNPAGLLISWTRKLVGQSAALLRFIEHICYFPRRAFRPAELGEGLFSLFPKDCHAEKMPLHPLAKTCVYFCLASLNPICCLFRSSIFKLFLDFGSPGGDQHSTCWLRDDRGGNGGKVRNFIYVHGGSPEKLGPEFWVSPFLVVTASGVKRSGQIWRRNEIWFATPTSRRFFSL